MIDATEDLDLPDASDQQLGQSTQALPSVLVHQALCHPPNLVVAPLHQTTLELDNLPYPVRGEERGREGLEQGVERGRARGREEREQVEREESRVLGGRRE